MSWKDLAPRAGFEPATIRLTVGCSTAELPRNERRLGPRGPAYNKAGAACKARDRALRRMSKSGTRIARGEGNLRQNRAFAAPLGRSSEQAVCRIGRARRIAGCV